LQAEANNDFSIVATGAEGSVCSNEVAQTGIDVFVEQRPGRAAVLIFIG